MADNKAVLDEFITENFTTFYYDMILKSYISIVSPFIDNPTISILFHFALNFDYQDRFFLRILIGIQVIKLMSKSRRHTSCY